MEWLKSLYEFSGSQYPRLSLLVAATIGAVVFGGGWWLLGKQYEKAKLAASAPAAVLPAASASALPAQAILSPAQERLLELVASHQRQFAARKLVIGRKTGVLHFDDDQPRSAGVSLLRDLFGSDDSTNAPHFEQLVESMPPEYLRLLPEMRWDSPFVVSVTEAGMKYLQSRK